MTDKFFNAMGLCRRAGKLSIGHDDVKTSLKSGKAELMIFASDASERLKDEMKNLSAGIKCIEADATMDEIKFSVAKRAGVFTVTDKGLASLVQSTIKEDSIDGTGQ